MIVGYTCHAVTGTTPGGILYAEGNTCLESLACPTGKRAISGGYSLPSHKTYVDSLNTVMGPTVWALASYPSDANGGYGAVTYDHWTVAVYNGSTGDAFFAIFVTCADMLP